MSNDSRIQRHVSSLNFVQIPNETIRDPNISAKAKGLLCVILSFPDDWSFNQTHLQKMCSDGRDGHRSGWDELESKGFIRREWNHKRNGHFAGQTWHVSDRPIFKDSNADGKHETGNNENVKPATTNTESSTKTETTTNTDPPPTSSKNQQQLTPTDQSEKVNPPIPEYKPLEPDYQKAKGEDEDDIPVGMPKIGTRQKITAIRRADIMEFKTRWFKIFRPSKWTTNPQNDKRLRFIRAYWTPNELHKAMKITARKANNPGWGYFSSVLEKMHQKGEAPKTLNEAQRIQALRENPVEEEFEVGVPIWEQEAYAVRGDS